MKARAPAARPATANSSPTLVRKPNSKAATKADIAKPVDSYPQKGAVRQGGGIVPSGLLQPPGRSSSAVTRVPRRGQPTKIAKAESPHPRPVAKWTTRGMADTECRIEQPVFHSKLALVGIGAVMFHLQNLIQVTLT